jgi:hypothetical protein
MNCIPARRARLEVAHFSPPCGGGEANHETPKGRKPESRTMISHDKNMGGQENTGLVDLPVNFG